MRRAARAEDPWRRPSAATPGLVGDQAVPERRQEPPASVASAVKARSAARQRSEELQSRLLAAITKSAGQRKEQLCAALGRASKDRMLVTNKLLADGAIRKRGVERATRYYPR
jgi:hypothetical protein